MDLQSTDRGKRHNCTVFSFASDHRNSEGSVLQLKMVAATGNAPVYSALQADANLSQLSSLLKFKVFGGCAWKLHTDVLLTSMRKKWFIIGFSSFCSLWKPHIAKPNNVTNQYFTTLAASAERRILRTLGLLWSSLVVNLSWFIFLTSLL